MLQRLSIHPDIPTQGGSLTICYDASGLEITTVTLDLEWTPSGLQPASTTITINQGDGCKTILTPDAATHLTISDTSGNSSSLKTTVNPASVPANGS